MSAKVIFACVHNAGRSQIAAAFFNLMADPHRAHAISAGTEPAAQVHDEVVTVMSEIGIDLSAARPRRLTVDLERQAALLVTMGCGEGCPVLPGVERRDWPLDDPKSLPLEHVRVIRDAIRIRVQQLLAEKGWNRLDY
jgi:arsenate reductase